MRVIISGGGTGGHIFPALAIAEAIKSLQPATEFLFVGAEGKMEMERVPKAGYKIVGLEVVGFQRRLTWKNLLFPFKLWKSLRRAKAIVKEFKPDIAIGVGGYASGPTLQMAGKMGIPTLLQEQNSFAGVTNRLLAKRAAKICVAYENVKRFFPEEKMILTGNPVRKDIADMGISLQNKPTETRAEALAYYGFSTEKQTVFITGGSLGARTLNNALRDNIAAIDFSKVQILWQVGKIYYDEFKSLEREGLKIVAFVDRMDYAYAMADVVAARAGALTISELCVLGKASILIPSPNVSEDHQTANAMALVEKQAAILVKDAEANQQLVNTILELLNQPKQIEQLAQNIAKLGISNAAERIAKEVMKIVGV